MIRIYLFFSYKPGSLCVATPCVATFTSDEVAIEMAREINAVALFRQINVFNPIPAEVPESALRTREFCATRWTELLVYG